MTMKDEIAYSSAVKLAAFAFVLSSENQIVALCLLVVVVSASAATMSPGQIDIANRAKRFVCASLLGVAALLGFVMTGYDPVYYMAAFVISFVVAFAPEILKAVLKNRLGGIK